MPTPLIKLTGQALNDQKQRYDEVLKIIRHFLNKLIIFMGNAPVIVAVSDDEACLIDVFGDQELIEKMGVMEGSYFGEEVVGTNSIHLCLKHKQAIQIKGDEHFFSVLHNFCCTSCCFQLNDSSSLSGTISLMTLIDQADKIHIGLLSSVVDAIERELALGLQKQKLELLNEIMMNTTRNGIVITDNEGKVIKVNQSAEKIFALSRKDVVGKNVSSFPPFGAYISEVLKNNKTMENMELTFDHPILPKRHIIMDAQPLYNRKKELQGAFGQFWDYTDRYNLELQVIENEKFSAIGKLGAGLAHEIRNPLTPVIGFLQLINERISDNEETKVYMKVVKDELERIKQLVTDFVMMARPEAPSKKLESILEIVQETVQLMESQGNVYNTTIKVNYRIVGVALILIDKMQFKQVLINLIQNSMEAIEDQGEITIEISASDDQQIIIEFSDNGSGMDESEMNKLFTPFFSTKETGIGLGLSVCYRIIHNHKGSITVQSEKGKGTTFFIKFPLQMIREDKA